jgi:hypothetical protein
MLNKEMLFPLNHIQFESLHVPQQNLIQTIKCGEACQLMTLAKEHKSMDVIITFYHKLERSSEGSIPRSHLGDIHYLNEGKQMNLH